MTKGDTRPYCRYCDAEATHYCDLCGLYFCEKDAEQHNQRKINIVYGSMAKPIERKWWLKTIDPAGLAEAVAIEEEMEKVHG